MVQKRYAILTGAFALILLGAGCRVAPPPTAEPVAVPPSGGEAIMEGPGPAMEGGSPDADAAMEEKKDEGAMMEAKDGITLAEIAKHNSPDDCWFAIDGKVYDVSGYDSKHPGGQAVYAGCGKDATVLFETRPMGSGTPHSDKARSFLPNFEIGVLAN